MFYLTTCDPDIAEVKTQHFASRLLFHDAVKEFMRQALDDDDAFDELIRAHLATSENWHDSNTELLFLRDLFEEELSGHCPDIIWGEVPMPAAEDTQSLLALLKAAVD